MRGVPRKSNSVWGKALGAFGIGSGSAENTLFRRKLASIHTFFPHDDNPPVNVAQLYNDLFELLSPFHYLDSNKKDALQLLLDQLRVNRTTHLGGALLKRSPIEIKHCLSEIMSTCMDGIERVYDARYWSRTKAALRPTYEEAKLLIPTLQLVTRIAIQSDDLCETVLEAGVLDMILRVYVIFPTFAQSTIDGPEPWTPLSNACRSLLLALHDSPPNQHTVLQHPICSLWAECRPLPPSYSERPISLVGDLSQRSAAWRRAPPPCIKRRISTIYLSNLWRANANQIEDWEACSDIVEMCRVSFYDREIVDLAFLVMMKSILTSGESARQLMDSIARIPEAEMVRILAGVIQLWLECVISGIPSDLDAMDPKGWFPHNYTPAAIDHGDSFYDREKDHIFRRVSNADAAVHNLLKFYTVAAKRHDSVRIGLLRAGVLSLVLSTFVSAEFRLPCIGRTLGLDQRNGTRGKHKRPLQPLPLDTINDEASTLTILMLDPLFSENWDVRQLAVRRALCSRMVDSLMGDSRTLDAKYLWSCALCKKITGK